VNFRRFSPEREIDDSIPDVAPPKARLEVFPEIDLVASDTVIGVGARLQF